MIRGQASKSRSVVEQTVQRIQALIRKKRLQPGERLPSESELIRLLRVSRSALREAVRRLETLGQIKVVHGSGMYAGDGESVARFVQLLGSLWTVTPVALTQFQQFRAELECLAARKAAENPRAEDVAELYAHCDAMELSGHDFHEVVAADCAFHLKLAAMTGNDVLLGVMRSLQEFLKTAIWHMGLKRLEDRRDNPRAHRQIADAIAAGNSDRAEAAMRVHMALAERQAHAMEEQTRE
jgi:DNA-binding FadR family transcriptional regulator